LQLEAPHFPKARLLYPTTREATRASKEGFLFLKACQEFNGQTGSSKNFNTRMILPPSRN